MRKFALIVLAAVISSGAPEVATPVEASSLFETLFPRAAERRRLREKRRRERERRLKYGSTSTKTRVKGPVYKTYYADAHKEVRFDKLSQNITKLTQTERDAKQKELIDLVADRNFSLDAAVKNIQGNNRQIALANHTGQMRDIGLKVSGDVAEALVTFYSENPNFFWVNDNGPTPTALKILSVLENADSFGLNASDYSVPTFSLNQTTDQNRASEAKLAFEFRLSAALLQYARDARHGLVNPNKISGYHDFPKVGKSDGALISALASSVDPVPQMLDLHPNEDAFFALKEELAVQRARAQRTESISIKDGTFLKPGQTSDQLELIVEIIRRKGNTDLRAKHFDVLAVDHSEGLYSEDVVALVKDFQRQVKLRPDGIVGRNTIAKLTTENPQKRIDQVLYAMERLRWHPDKLGNTHVFINQPAYRASYMRDGKPALSMRVIVGKPRNQTSFFYDEIEYVEYNPYWGVPRSILVNEMLPKLRANPGYLDRLGYEVTTVRGRRISSSNVDWYGVGADFPFNVRQPPGARNALGELKIMFPNKHSIYMHDTPSRNLFSRQQRALSHGCVRLAEPRKMAAAVLGTTVNFVSGQVNQGRNKKQDLKVKVPVYVAYFTAWPDADGTVHYFTDIYGRDKALSKAFAAERKVRASNT